MADTLTAPPPTATPAAAPSQPQQAARVEIPASAIAPGTSAQPPPKPGSARARMFADLEKRAINKTPEEPAVKPAFTAKPNANAKPTDTTVAQPGPDVAAEPAATGEDGPTADPATPAAEPKDGKKVSPWKIVDQYKTRTAALEKELASLKTGAVPEAERKVIQERIEKAEARNKELEDEIRYVNYEKSTDFQTKYQQPFTKAWQEAMAELSEIQVDAGNGVPRAATADDLLSIVNLPLGQAKEVAEQLFGNFAPEAMAHAKDIKKLFKQRTEALEEAKKTGSEREKKIAFETEKQTLERNSKITEHWEKAKKQALEDPKHGKFFKPIDGDQDGNQRLAKGYELADRAFTENPNNPNLSAEQRNAIIERHAAVRNRAAAYGRIVKWNADLEAKISELQKEIDQYKGSDPDTVTQVQRTPVANGAPASAWDAMREKLRSLAK